MKHLRDGLPDMSMRRTGPFLFDSICRANSGEERKLQHSTIDGYRTAIAE